MERTLYLNENPGMRVSRDGPSLWIEQRGRAGQRVPARVVRLVLIAGNVALDTGSLTLFAERGIPITLLNRHGEPVAAVIGVSDGDRQRRARQAAVLEDARKRDRVRAWLAAWERGRRLTLVRRLTSDLALRWRCRGFRSVDYEAWLMGQARLRGASLAARGFFRGALHALVLAEVTAGGWDPHLGVRHRAQSLGFVKDCLAALGADADGLWLEAGSVPAWSSDKPAPHVLAARFESRKPRLEGLTRRLLDQYATILWEV